MKGYGVVLARKPYPFILYPAHVVGVKFTRNLYKPHAEKFLRSFFQKAGKFLRSFFQKATKTCHKLSSKPKSLIDILYLLLSRLGDMSEWKGRVHSLIFFKAELAEGQKLDLFDTRKGVLNI